MEKFDLFIVTRVKSIVWLFTVLLMGNLLVACTEMTKINLGDEGVIYCSNGNPESFNPQLSTANTTTDASSYQIYDRLVEFDPITNKVIPSLALSWMVKNNGLVYVFQLRKDVSFHSNDYFQPTRAFNADDVVFSIDRWRSWEHPYHDVSGGYYPYFANIELDSLIKDIKRIDSYRIEIHLNKPNGSFLANLATDFSVILSAEYGDYLLDKGQPEHIDQFPIGTGPFQFVKHQKDRYIRYQKNPLYWRDTPIVEQLIFDITPTSSQRLAKLMTGECDVLRSPTTNEINIIRKRDNLVLDEKTGLNLGYWAFNTTKPPFDNPEVRRALAMSIDINTLLDAIYLDSAIPANSLIPPSSWAHNEEITGVSYNPVLARELLEENGIEEGFTMNIWAIPVKRTYQPNAPKMAEIMSDFLSDIGVNVNVITLDWNTFRRRIAERNYDSILIGWAANNGDPDNFYRPLLSCDGVENGSNRANWCSPQFDELIDEALTYTDETTRAALYQSANALIADQMPLVPIAHAYQYQAYVEQVEGLVINPFGGIRFGGVHKSQ